MKSMKPYERIEWAYSIPDLNPTQKHVLVNLAFRANSTTWRAWPSLGKIADDLSMSRSSRPTIRKALKALRDRGLIHYQEQRAGLGEDQKSNQYVVAFNVTPWCSEHHPLVLTTPPPGAENTTNGEENGEENGESYTPSSDDEATVAPSLQGADAATAPYQATQAEQADPVSPAWYQSRERQMAIDLIRQCGWYSGADRDEQDRAKYEDVEAHLVGLLEESLGSEEFGMVYDYWTFSKAHMDPLKAATKLNQLISAVKTEHPGGIAYTPQRSTV